MNFANKRHIGFLIITIALIVIPWISNSSGAHIFLLSFIKQEFHFMGLIFSVQELHMMPFLVMLIFVGLFAITSLFGRFWCGWMCPQTIFRYVFRDLIQTKLLKLRRNTKDKQKEPDYSKFINKVKLASSYLIFFVLACCVSINFMLYFVSYEYFFAHFLDPYNHFILFAFFAFFAFMTMLLVTITKESFCIYACPYARVQSILYDKHTFTTVYNLIRGGVIYKDNKKVINNKKDFVNNEECIACEQCVKVCPTGIDIRKGLQIECIECLECVDACTDVMGKKDKKSLIEWNSESSINLNKKTVILRGKTLAYGAAIVAIIGLLIFNAGGKTNFQLNIHRTSQLYSPKPLSIQNAYVFLFQNTDNKKHTYYFEVDNKDIKILRPTEPFSLKAKSKTKKIVALSIDKTLLSKYENEKIKIKVTAYELKNKESKVVKDSIFIFPKDLNDK